METRFKVLTDISKLDFRTFGLLDPTILEPTAATPLYQGEWLVIDGTTGKLKRLSTAGATTCCVFPVIDQEFQYDARALGSVSVIYASVFEFLTSVYDANHAPATIGAACYVGLVNGRMVIDDNTAGGNSVIARVTAPASGGFLKAIRIWA